MITSLWIVRAQRRRTHIVSRDGLSLCGHAVNPYISTDIKRVDMAGGATTRVVHDFKAMFNDDTCCMRCTRILRMLVLCHVTRDNGVR